ncbi:crossover junction endodeoxyribonuclease RuvC [uncultured Thermanaerothrix sp.]|uniref:crossover junction endodeoxyribonuclease RuvC n=1 Tax=uncultured Thermanaerothrix sp. TaxID=1195149 RepID=UPI0026185379|nr:crossover junction endodeoxyribonuclease RuvC [uncultured Thermanaerothrix sp.]
MMVVGIDPGTATTGYGIVQDKGRSLEAVTYGVVTTAPFLPLEQRLAQLFDELSALIQRFKPESAAVEQLFFQRNVRTAMAVGQARGVALLALAKAGLSVGEYSPLQVKQAVTGYGGADKNQVQQMVRLLLNLSEIPRPDDAADALAIAICHLHHLRTTQQWRA